MPANTADPKAARTLKVKLVRSVIGSNPRQRATVESLGLRRMQQVVALPDSPATRGMVQRVRHLVAIVEEA